MKHLILSLISGLAYFSCWGQQPPSLRFDHQALQVKDLDRSAVFYHELLGLPEIDDKTGAPHIRWFSMGDLKELHLIEDQNAPEPPVKGVHMALSATSLDELTVYLKEKGVYFENWMGEPFTTNTRPDGIRQIYLQDPDGYWIEINGL